VPTTPQRVVEALFLADFENRSMDDWQDVGVALQGVFVCFGAVAVLVDAAGIPGVVDPFVLGTGLFAVGFALGALVAVRNDDARGTVANVVAVAGWMLVLAGDGGCDARTWSGIALLALAGVTFCQRAIRNVPVRERLPV